jgi:glucan phosphoethanolaminetransferase (alkaline phosphatase superfamily)
MNSVLYIDKLIYDFIEYFKKRKQPFVLYYTSDHAELLGFPEEKGRYFHSVLDKHCAYVPFIYYSNAFPKELNQSFYSHYQISKMITRDLGFELINPNEVESIYYINSPIINGSGGYIEYNISNFIDN